jgi:hypothetical protein
MTNWLRSQMYALAVALRLLFGPVPAWRELLHAGLPLPAISGGAGETKTTFANALKESR